MEDNMQPTYEVYDDSGANPMGEPVNFTPGSTPGGRPGLATPEGNLLGTPAGPGIGDDIAPFPTPGTPVILPPAAIPDRTPKQRKKRPPPVDSSTYLDAETIRKGLSDTSDIVRDIVPAPASKKAMVRKEKEIAGIEVILRAPIMEGLAPELLNLFSRNMVSVEAPVEAAKVREEYEPATPGKPTGDVDDYPQPEEPYYPEMNVPEMEYTGGVPEAGEPEIGYPTGETTEGDVAATSPTEGLSDQTRRMHKFLKTRFTEAQEKENLSYLEMIEGRRRKTVVGTFFELLVLKTTNYINLKQEEPYGDITISKTAQFDVLVS
eukprot:TRINITY_DN8400_c0_g1_i4.p1 TRINITY_DN8400_c0_g1~~TRINITY_DN8400_c0_g1_i4.p1  ORF type:complete len:320 (+),score=92.53 TRINITY_DN8400_c0_g1_i4:419-1378(+)